MNETANEIKRLQGCINDLIGVLALPAVWKGQDAKQIVKTLLDVLVAMLRLDFAYVLLKDPVGGGPIEMVRHDQPRHLAAEPGLVGQTLTQSLGASPRKWPPRAKNPFGKGSLAIVPLGSGRDDQIGVIVAGSERADFPWQTETVVLSVAANQAAIGLASARAYEGKIRRLVDANIVGIFIWDFKGRILEANDAFLRMVHYGREDVGSGGLRWTDLTPPEWLELDLRRRVRELKATGVVQPFEREFFRKDGSRVPVLVGGALFEESGNEGVAFVLDLTERKRVEQSLQLRVNMLQQIPVAAWSVKPDGTPDIVNQLWFEYTGQTPEYVNSHPEAWMATIHPEDRERASGIFWEGIRSGRGFTMEARFLRASDRTYRWHLNRAVAVRDGEGNILRFVGTSTDVHDWRQVQEELRNTQAEFAHITRLVTMGELTASIAHEVNQPLGAMVTSAASCARWLAAKPPQMVKAQRALQRIVNDGRRAGAIIERIRSLMKRQTLPKQWLDVNETILEVIALTQYDLRRNGIVPGMRLAEHLPRIPGDKVQVQQVLLNLIVNAMEAMSNIEQRRRELTIVSAKDQPDGVRVEVRDSGRGLDPERASQLFEPFYTTKAQGLGIGLSISRSIVEAHGGRLSAGANAPHGAVFCIWLPGSEQMS